MERWNREGRSWWKWCRLKGITYFFPSLLRVAPTTRALTLGMELHFSWKVRREPRAFLLRWAFVWNDPDPICFETRASAWQHTHESDVRCYIARFGMSCLHWHHKNKRAERIQWIQISTAETSAIYWELAGRDERNRRSEKWKYLDSKCTKLWRAFFAANVPNTVAVLCLLFHAHFH